MIEQKMKHLQGLEKQKADLLKRLDISLAVRDLWPGVFDKGAVSHYWHGTDRAPMLVVKVMADDGTQEREFRYKDVPEVLQKTIPAALCPPPWRAQV